MYFVKRVSVAKVKYIFPYRVNFSYLSKTRDVIRSVTMHLIARTEIGSVYFSKSHDVPESRFPVNRLPLLSLSTLSFRHPFVASHGLFFFLLRRHRYDSFCRLPPIARPPPTPVCPPSSLLFLPPSLPRCAPSSLPSYPPLPQPFSGPVGKARETFIFARRKSKAEREVLPTDRYCEADVFCDSSVIRERVRERREKPKAPRCSLARSLARSFAICIERSGRSTRETGDRFTSRDCTSVMQGGCTRLIVR